MPFVNANGVKLFYQDKGEGKETVVFAHGLLWSHRMFSEQVEVLSQHFRVIAYDHRGQGQSESKAPFDMETVAEDAIALIEQLNLGRVHFVGLSMGGFVGMRIAASSSSTPFL